MVKRVLFYIFTTFEFFVYLLFIYLFIIILRRFTVVYIDFVYELNHTK